MSVTFFLYTPKHPKHLNTKMGISHVFVKTSLALRSKPSLAKPTLAKPTLAKIIFCFLIVWILFLLIFCFFFDFFFNCFFFLKLFCSSFFSHGRVQARAEPRKSGVGAKSGAPKCGRRASQPRRVGSRRVGARRVGGPKFRAFFFPLSRRKIRSFLLSLESSRGILVVFEAGRSSVHVWSSLVVV